MSPKFARLRRITVAVEGAVWAKSLTGYNGLASSDQQDGGMPPEDLKHRRSGLNNAYALFICGTV